ncbi:class I SAM-dependent methyltransferase [Desulfobaculum sp. SPO524]|uniref:class I SAM-dependent methyltransferase n=1 Tax=Desulfobaculum sp. SPO524 TaxID=3378071 RepID=UPI0038542AF0
MPAPRDMSFYRYDESHRFAAEYPRLARQVVADFELTQGLCLDLGTGGAALAIEMAKLTRMRFVGVDNNAGALGLARENGQRHGVTSQRLSLVAVDVHALPLAAGSVDFVISRGSIPFWADRSRVLAEVHRVLRPDGRTFIGCGFSRDQPQEAVEKMRPAWAREDSDDERMRWRDPDVLRGILEAAGVETYLIMRQPGYGHWIDIRK